MAFVSEEIVPVNSMPQLSCNKASDSGSDRYERLCGGFERKWLP